MPKLHLVSTMQAARKPRPSTAGGVASDDHAAVKPPDAPRPTSRPVAAAPPLPAPMPTHHDDDTLAPLEGEETRGPGIPSRQSIAVGLRANKRKEVPSHPVPSPEPETLLQPERAIRPAQIASGAIAAPSSIPAVRNDKFDRDGFAVRDKRPIRSAVTADPPRSRSEQALVSHRTDTGDDDADARRGPVDTRRTSGGSTTSPTRPPIKAKALPVPTAVLPIEEEEDRDDGLAYYNPAIGRDSGSSFGIGSGVFDPYAPKIRVIVRKRPLSKKESRLRELDVVQVVSSHTMLVHEPKQKVDLTRYTESHDFTFDEVFESHISTEEVYRHTAQKLIAGIFKGTNATCFAYGQTGSHSQFCACTCCLLLTQLLQVPEKRSR
jgi:hypothetical protein